MSVAIAISSRRAYEKAIPAKLHLELCIAVLLLSVLVFRIWVKIETTDLGYSLAQERKTAIELDMRRRELELAQSVMQKSDSIQARAKRELGMSVMDPRQARRM